MDLGKNIEIFQKASNQLKQVAKSIVAVVYTIDCLVHSDVTTIGERELEKLHTVSRTARLAYIAFTGVRTCRTNIRYTEYAPQHFLTYQAHSIAEYGGGRKST